MVMAGLIPSSNYWQHYDVIHRLTAYQRPSCCLFSFYFGLIYHWNINFGIKQFSFGFPLYGKIDEYSKLEI